MSKVKRYTYLLECRKCKKRVTNLFGHENTKVTAFYSHMLHLAETGTIQSCTCCEPREQTVHNLISITSPSKN